MKAGLAATACSALILAIVLRATAIALLLDADQYVGALAVDFVNFEISRHSIEGETLCLTFAPHTYSQFHSPQWLPHRPHRRVIQGRSPMTYPRRVSQC